jgi:hypothetical protein
VIVPETVQRAGAAGTGLKKKTEESGKLSKVTNIREERNE